MSEIAEARSGNTFTYFEFYYTLFEAADVTSFFWQPVLTAIGRSQLEFAGLQSRQAQAVVHWAHQMLRPASPLDVLNANAQLWRTLGEQAMEVMPRVAAAVDKASEAVLLREEPETIRRQHDTIILLDREPEAGWRPKERTLERKVA